MKAGIAPAAHPSIDRNSSRVPMSQRIPERYTIISAP